MQEKSLNAWYTLDNSAKIYPAVMSRRWAAVFRVSITLTEPIDPAILQNALEDTEIGRAHV